MDAHMHKHMVIEDLLCNIKSFYACGQSIGLSLVTEKWDRVIQNKQINAASNLEKPV